MGSPRGGPGPGHLGGGEGTEAKEGNVDELRLEARSPWFLHDWEALCL